MKSLDALRRPIAKKLIPQQLEDSRSESYRMFLRQPPVLSRALVWTILLITVALVLWAFLARMDEVVPAVGKIEPLSSVAVVQAAEGGVMKRILVREGDRVTSGQVLIELDPVVSEVSLKSLKETLANLKDEYSAYAKVLSATEAETFESLAQGLPEDVRSLARNRAHLISDNRLATAQLRHSMEGISLTDEQKKHFEIAEQDWKEKLQTAKIKAEGADVQHKILGLEVSQYEKLIKNQAEILDAYHNLKDKNAVSQVEILERESNFLRTQSQIEMIRERQVELAYDRAKAKEEEKNATTQYEKQVIERRTLNLRALAEIDANLGKMMIEVKRRMAEAESRIAEEEQRLARHHITSPYDGVVIEILHKSPGAVLRPSEPILKVVPENDELIAAVQIPNDRIGFVKLGQECEVRLDTFPFREFGHVKGKLMFIAADAVPNANQSAYVFPAKIRLDGPITLGGNQVRLQAGMAVSANIHLRTRSVASLALDFLLSPVEKLEQVR